MRALSQLEAADTVEALSSLRELTRTEDRFAPGWGLLGRVLTARAGGVAGDFRERREAERALNRALELDGDNPGYLAALGRLKRKQQIYLDSRRLLDRALKRLEEDPGSLAPDEAAQLWFERGLFYEDEYLDARHLVFAPTLPVQGVDCPGEDTFCLNFTNPRDFNEYLRHAADLSGLPKTTSSGPRKPFEKPWRRIQRTAVLSAVWPSTISIAATTTRRFSWPAASANKLRKSRGVT